MFSTSRGGAPLAGSSELHLGSRDDSENQKLRRELKNLQTKFEKYQTKMDQNLAVEEFLEAEVNRLATDNENYCIERKKIRNVLHLYKLDLKDSENMIEYLTQTLGQFREASSGVNRRIKVLEKIQDSVKEVMTETKQTAQSLPSLSTASPSSSQGSGDAPLRSRAQKRHQGTFGGGGTNAKNEAQAVEPHHDECEDKIETRGREQNDHQSMDRSRDTAQNCGPQNNGELHESLFNVCSETIQWENNTPSWSPKRLARNFKRVVNDLGPSRDLEKKTTSNGISTALWKVKTTIRSSTRCQADQLGSGMAKSILIEEIEAAREALENDIALRKRFERLLADLEKANSDKLEALQRASHFERKFLQERHKLRQLREQFVLCSCSKKNLERSATCSCLKKILVQSASPSYFSRKRENTDIVWGCPALSRKWNNAASVV